MVFQNSSCTSHFTHRNIRTHAHPCTQHIHLFIYMHTHPLQGNKQEGAHILSLTYVYIRIKCLIYAIILVGPYGGILPISAYHKACLITSLAPGPYVMPDDTHARPCSLPPLLMLRGLDCLLGFYTWTLAPQNCLQIQPSMASHMYTHFDSYIVGQMLSH